MSAVDELLSAYADPRAAALAFKARGGQVVGLIGSDVPEEIIAAAGLLPVRLRAETGASDAPADRYGEGGGNAVIRAFVARLLDGSYDYVDHLVVATTPSYLGALFTFLREIQRQDARFPRLPLQLFDFHHSASPVTRRFNRESADRLKAAAETWSGRAIADDDLARAIADSNAARAAVARLQDLRLAGRISGAEALALIGAGAMLPRAEYAAKLAAAVGELAGRAVRPGPRVVFSGSETETPDLYRRIEAEGLTIVADDQGWGSRVAERPVAGDGDPLQAIVERYHFMAPAPAKSSTEARIAYLLDLVRRTDADGVIFAVRGLDHPAAWDAPSQIAALEDIGVAVVQLPPAAVASGPLGEALAPLLKKTAHG
ncbi:2-hydroxyacyl-CoA dehydratase subunit D [Phenylobacterium soli]|uniref:2-hydroxyacyl-CoA dehydratase n=1 Tax=Phenylobacterium soli TaxID=2170551 RepID=A0A328AC53_9CAUL|nr:2-hydroxyacyl-CoA dehydratase family protein [Phenylobacterium soli]RAK51776.1 hypothetical protein DJ017_18300 [Phenylobacterium soli]